jgi:hypothetical protein
MDMNGKARGSQYHCLIQDADYKGQVIGGREMGKFDVRVFWAGKRFRHRIPSDVRLVVKREDEGLELPDLFCNSASWYIFSRRLLDLWWIEIQNDVQLFDAPIYRESDGGLVGGYKLVNPIRIVDCMDFEKSEISWDKDGSISSCWTICIKADKAAGHHMFRLKGYLPTLIVSDELAQRLKGKGFKGMAFWRCKTS